MGSDWCMEMDWIEANGHCAAATTVHTKEGPGNDGCTAWGCRTTYHFNGTSKFHMKIAYDETGQWTVSKDGEVFTDYSPVPDGTTWDLVKSTHESRGAVIYGSEWIGWVPVEDCGTTAGDLYNSSYSISNLVISGSVVQGPVPTKCSQPATTPTPTTTTTAPGRADLYCPSVEDLTIAYCDKSCPQLINQGWKIEGGGGAATKSAFNLNGGFVEFDLDVSNVDGGVNANLYTISPESFASDHFNKTLDYCDGAATGSDWCMEMDWIEANGHCAAATTVHTKEGPGNDGCTAWGCRTTYHFNGK